MNTLIVPLDGSELAETALPWAALFARSQGLSITLVRVLWVRRYSVDLAQDVVEEHTSPVWKEAATYLARVKQELEHVQGVEVTTTVREGLTDATILDLAAKVDASAIVMSTHGRGGLIRTVLGSVADDVVRRSSVPVLLVPPGAGDPPEQLDAVLVPLDGSALAESALPIATKVAAAKGKVVLVRVVAPVVSLVGLGSMTQSMFDEQATLEAEAEAEAYLVDVLEPLEEDGIDASHLVLRGVAVDQIQSAAETTSARLIVMSTRGNSGMRRLRLGSVADEVIRTGKVPVFLITTRMLAARAASRHSVQDLMRTDFAILSPDETLSNAGQRMLAHRSPVAPIVDLDGSLIGALSVRDLLHWYSGLRPGEQSVDGGLSTRASAKTVAEILPEESITIDVTGDLADAAAMLLQYRLDGLTVVRDRRPVGILTVRDIVEAASETETVGPAS